MTKDEFDTALSAGPIKPVLRTMVGDREVFIADGYVPSSFLPFLSRFGMSATEEEYPFGVFATIWYCESRIGWCGLLLCDALHNPGHSNEARQDMRAKSAVAIARKELSRKSRMH